MEDRKRNLFTGEVVKDLNKFLKEFIELENFRNRKYIPIYNTGDGLGEIMTKEKNNRLDEYKWNLLALWVSDLFWRL